MEFTTDERYSSTEMTELMHGIEEGFGPVTRMIQGSTRSGLRVDVAVIAPTKTRGYQTLVTIGMGAHRQELPAEQARHTTERVELVMSLPSDWMLDENDPKSWWPVTLMQTVSHLPVEMDTWIGVGNKFDQRRPFAEDTKLSSILFLLAQDVPDDYAYCPMPEGDPVTFLQMIPIYRSESLYQNEHGTTALLKKLEFFGHVVDKNRPDSTGLNEFTDPANVIDDVAWHIKDAQRAGVEATPMQAAMHLAVWLSWCINKGFASDWLKENHPELKPGSPVLEDCRRYILEKLDGRLLLPYFNELGQRFTRYCNLEDSSPNFFDDVRNQGIAAGQAQRVDPSKAGFNYLQFKFSKDYVQNLEASLDLLWRKWLALPPSQRDLEPLPRTMIRMLDCDCTYFPPSTDDKPLMEAFEAARREGAEQGYTPVIVCLSKELLDQIADHLDPDDDIINMAGLPDPRILRRRRRAIFAHQAEDDMRTRIEEGIRLRRTEAEQDGYDWEIDIIGEMKDGVPVTKLTGCRDSAMNSTVPCVLAKIPVEHAWQVFGWIPFGGWNDCPQPEPLMTFARHWQERWGAVPAVIANDSVEFILEKPVPEEEAMQAALEQYAMAPDVVDRCRDGEPTVGYQADGIRQSTVWYLWWA